MSTGTTPKSTKSLNTKQRDWLRQMGATLGTRSTAGATERLGVQPIGVGVDDLLKEILPEIKALLKSLLGRRSIVVEVVNKTTIDIFMGKVTPKGGLFTKAPPDLIKSGDSAQFLWSSPENDFTAGAAGEMDWLLPDSRWHISWNHPRTGSPKGTSEVKGPIVENPDEAGDAFKFSAAPAVVTNADVPLVRVTLFGGPPKTDPKPGPKPGPDPKPGPAEKDIASSCLITVTNNSKQVLTLLDSTAARGNFMTPPPNSLAPGGVATFVLVETPNNTDPNDEGCKGSVLWEVGSPRIGTCLMEWDNPEGAQNTASAKFDPTTTGLRVLRQIGQGDENVPVAFTISGGGGQTPPTPTTTGKLLVTVTEDTTSKPIEGATVAVAGKTAKTDKAGKTDFDLPAGDQQLVVTADGFEEGRAGATVKSGEKTDVAMFMQKKQAAPEFKEPVESKQPTLRPGDDNADGWVEFMQSLLLKHFGDSIKQDINGKYDKQTEANVRKFQAGHKPKPLQVDGVVGNQTWAALRKAPDEAVGTDGRKPHTFVEKGPEARWVCEQTNFEIKIDSDKDTVIMSLASVGTEPVDKFQATIFVTPQGGKKTQLPPITIGPATLKRETGSGDIHQVVLKGFAAKFGAGTHVIQGFLPQELGGDKFEDKVLINKSGATGAVVVTVTNKATGRPIENATVDINGAKDQTTKTGLVNIDGIQAGNRPFKVTANGFQDESGTVDVPGDENAPAAILKVALKPAK